MYPYIKHLVPISMFLSLFNTPGSAQPSPLSQNVSSMVVNEEYVFELVIVYMFKPFGIFNNPPKPPPHPFPIVFSRWPGSFLDAG
jgi:hypothetical protein